MLTDVMNGEGTIKQAGEKYCPRLEGQSDMAYKNYVTRGTFFNASYRTYEVMLGVLFSKPPVIINENIIPPEVMDNITGTGTDINQFLRLLTGNLIQYGYAGVLTDMNDAGEPYLAIYKAQSILNCQVVAQADGSNKLMLLSLGEIIEVPSLSDPYLGYQIQQIRLLYLDTEGLLTVEVYQLHPANDKGDVVWIKIGDTVYPQVRGKRCDYIPFTFFGTKGNSYIPPRPPLLDLAYLNIKHWQVSVDYYYGLHYCAMPTPWAAGFQLDQKDSLNIGCGSAWVSSDPQARCGYLEFTGQGLGAVRQALSDLEEQMAIVGARALEVQKKTAEAADTVARYQSADEAILATIANNIESGMKIVAKYLGNYLGEDTSSIRIALNTDFLTYEISSDQIRALVEAAQAGYISIDTFLWNLKQGDALPDDVSIEDEKERIKAELTEMGMTRKDLRNVGKMQGTGLDTVTYDENGIPINEGKGKVKTKVPKKGKVKVPKTFPAESSGRVTPSPLGSGTTGGAT